MLFRSHNFKSVPVYLDSAEGRNGMGDLLKTSSIPDNAQVRFNRMDGGVLAVAKAHPDKRWDLMVRVAGYSPFSTELRAEVQDEIINRTAIK